MINLDMCGYGDTIVISVKGNVDNSAFYGILDKKIINKHAVTTVGFLPNGDDDRLADCNIPNMFPYSFFVHRESSGLILGCI